MNCICASNVLLSGQYRSEVGEGRPVWMYAEIWKKCVLNKNPLLRGFKTCRFELCE